MKSAIIVHGMPSKEDYLKQGLRAANQHWFPWLKRELTVAGVLAQMPEFPEPYEPDYETWRAVFEALPLTEETSLVGHSCGGGFLMRWLSENKMKAGKLALVAPWIDIDGRSAPKMFTGYSADLSLPERLDGMALFASSDDDEEELMTFKLLKSQYPSMTLFEYTDRGHFIGPKNETFPELRDWLLA
jgi:uncharacterized protein